MEFKGIKQKFSRTQLLRAIRIFVVAFTALQALTITVVTAYDYIVNKLAHRKPFKFPSLKPADLMVDDTTVRTYTEGKSLYKDMLNDIRQAEKYILFETFIWKNDDVGREFKRELLHAARRGVEVYIVFDGFGNFVVPRHFKKFPNIAHLNVLEFPFIRYGLFTFNLRQTGRDHRKILVVDGNIGYVGGYNIGSLYRDKWRDTHVRINGDLVWELENAFIDFWNTFRNKKLPAITEAGAKEWNSNLRAALNKPSQLLFPVRGLYLDAFDRAVKNIWITQAYFIPDQEFTNALIKAAKRGVDVKILIPKKSNHVIADWVASAYFDKLLESDIEIWQYENAMIHAKTCTVDGRWSTIGTANIDRLSLMGNFEVNIQIWSQQMAKRMEEIFINDMSNSTRLDLKVWNKRSILQRITERILQPLEWII